MKRARVVVLGGAGAMGRIAVRDLLQTASTQVEVVVADRDVAAVRGLEVHAVETDSADPASLQRALAGAFATIVALPYKLNLVAMRGALAAGAHYVDLGGLFHTTREQLRLGPEFERAGLMAILGMGSAPGILNVLAARAARRLDRVRAIHCLVGAVDRTRWKSASPLAFGYAPDTLLDEFAAESAVFRDGEFRMVPALDPRERIHVRFPKPVGAQWLDTTLHSEVATLPLSFAERGVREVTFRQSFEPEFLEKLRFLVRLGFADTTPVKVPAGDGAVAVAPRQVLLALLRRFPPPAPPRRQQRYEVLRAVVHGSLARRAVTVSVDCAAGPRSGRGLGPDIDTGAPPAIAVQLLLRGEMPLRPGVWAPEQVVPPEPFGRELAKRGLRLRERVTRTRTR